jgi:hypothetical protein
VDANNNLVVAMSGSQTLTGPLLLGDGLVGAPAYSFASEATSGIWRAGTQDIRMSIVGSDIWKTSGAGVVLNSAVSLFWGSTGVATPDLALSRAAANTLALRNGANAQTFQVGPTTAYASLQSGSVITPGSATGLTVNEFGVSNTLVYKVTLAQTAFVCAAVTCDVTIGTLPANTRVVSIDAKIATVFACTATCTSSTLSMIVGRGSGGSEYLASLDADAATSWFGDADAEMGTLMTRAAAIQGGAFLEASQAVVLRLTSGTGNIGSGAATNLSQGSVVIRIVTQVMP